MIDTFYHLIGNLLANLDTGIVSSLALVVACIGTVAKTLEELVHVSGVNAHTAYQEILQTLRLSHTHGVTHGVYIGSQVSLGC